jgi:hypothetical protein
MEINKEAGKAITQKIEGKRAIDLYYVLSMRQENILLANSEKVKQ